MADEREPPACRAARDGDCIWTECPQLKVYRDHCPLDAAWQAWHEKNGSDDYGR
jgi:hypothetical protein